MRKRNIKRPKWASKAPRAGRIGQRDIALRRANPTSAQADFGDVLGGREAGARL
jgi:hypothetical protein